MSLNRAYFSVLIRQWFDRRHQYLLFNVRQELSILLEQIILEGIEDEKAVNSHIAIRFYQSAGTDGAGHYCIGEPVC